MTNSKRTRAVIRVGDGRGFIVYGPSHDPIIITAGHCLPSFPPCHGSSYADERTYRALLGPLDKAPTIWAECLFADPIADVAVVGPPDGEELIDEWEAYDVFVEPMKPFKIGAAPWRGHGWVLSLDCRWLRCKVQHKGGALWLSGVPIEAGMSGSPVIADDGSAIGVVCLSSGGTDLGAHTEGGPNPHLAICLPAWVLHARKFARRRDARIGRMLRRKGIGPILLPRRQPQ